MTTPLLMSWAVAVTTLLVAALPVTQERLTRFVTLIGLSVTEANARQVIDHFAGLRRWRLLTVALAVPLACFTNDAFYLVLGWCAVSVFRDVRLPLRALPAPGNALDDARMYRGVWLLGSGGAVAAGAYLLTLLVLDHRGKTRMSPLRKFKDSLEDTYHLRPDGSRFVVLQPRDTRVETFDPGTGKRLSSVNPKFPGDDFIGDGLGWSKEGPFLLRGAMSERVYYLDLTAGNLWRRKK